MKAGYIHSTATLTSTDLLLNGQSVLTFDGNGIANNMEAVYRAFINDYPKFFRMDDTAKLSFVLGDVLCKHSEILSALNPDDLAIIMLNTSGSYPADIEHARTIEKGISQASPSNFVYTLPNIGIGELSIKWKITGENLFIIEERFSETTISDLADLYLSSNKAKAVLIGWVDPLDKTPGRMLLITKKASGVETENSPENIATLCVH